MLARDAVDTGFWYPRSLLVGLIPLAAFVDTWFFFFCVCVCITDVLDTANTAGVALSGIAGYTNSKPGPSMLGKATGIYVGFHACGGS